MIKKNFGTLNQYGLYKLNEDEDDPAEAYTLVASRTEQDIYDALGWSYCNPEDRK
jgi:DNA polymerase/3'-5' exonuclease PolX